MGEVSTIGLDIAKSIFQIHGVDADGAVVIRKTCAGCVLKVVSKMLKSTAKTPTRPQPGNIARAPKRRAVFGLSARAQSAAKASTTLDIPASRSESVMRLWHPCRGALHARLGRQPSDVSHCFLILVRSH